MLCIAGFHLIAPGSHHQEYAGIGTGILLFCFSYASIGSNYQFDMLELLNGMAGGLFSVACIRDVPDHRPSDSRWIKRRLARALRNQVVKLAAGRLPGWRRFESGTRDRCRVFASPARWITDDRDR